MRMYKGWISAEAAEEGDFLKNLGVKLGSWVQSEKMWKDCEVSEDALNTLDSYWGRFVWGLTPEEVGTKTE